MTPARFLSCFVCCATLLAAAACRPALAQTDWPSPALPDAVTAASVAEAMTLNGVPMRIRAFVSEKRPEELLDFYRHAWPRHVENRVGDATVLGRADGEFFTTVQVAAAGAGSRGVIAVTRRSSPTKGDRTQDTYRLPVGSELVSDMTSEDSGRLSRHMVFTNGRSVETNRDEIVGLLADKGFRLDREATSGGKSGQALFFSGRDREAIAVLSRAPGKTAVVMNVVTRLEPSW